MSLESFFANDARASITKAILGFFGVVTAFFLLPKTVKFFIRRYLLGFVGEILAVIIVGLLTEKATEQLGQDR